MQARGVLDAALPDVWLSDPADIGLAVERGNLERHLEGNLVVRMNLRGNVNVHPDIYILKLRIHERADAARPDTGGE